jgi:hypothetical protein
MSAKTGLPNAINQAGLLYWRADDYVFQMRAPMLGKFAAPSAGVQPLLLMIALKLRPSNNSNKNYTLLHFFGNVFSYFFLQSSDFSFVLLMMMRHYYLLLLLLLLLNPGQRQARHWRSRCIRSSFYHTVADQKIEEAQDRSNQADMKVD